MKNAKTASQTPPLDSVPLHPIVSCFSCGATPAPHVIREMSKRCGHHLCDQCHENEQIENRNMRHLCS